MKDDRLYLIHISECIERVWNILEKDLPALRIAVKKMLEQ